MNYSSFVVESSSGSCQRVAQVSRQVQQNLPQRNPDRPVEFLKAGEGKMAQPVVEPRVTARGVKRGKNERGQNTSNLTGETWIKLQVAGVYTAAHFQRFQGPRWR